MRLREYLLKGGFLWVDDFWGDAAWEQWVEEIQRVLPPRRTIRSAISRATIPIWRDDVPGRQAAADPVDQLLAAQRRRDLRARLGERRAAHPRHQRYDTAGSWC